MADPKKPDLDDLAPEDLDQVSGGLSEIVIEPVIPEPPPPPKR